MTRVLRAAAVLSLTAFLSAVAGAQAPVASPTTFVIMGGAAMPMGDLDDISNTGFTLGAGAEFGVSMLPFGLRAELSYTRFGEWELSSTEGSIATRPSNLAVTLNAIVGPNVPAAQIRPYFIGGVGFYNAEVDVELDSPDFSFSGSESKAGFGLNGGAGVRFRFVGFSSFVEARYHHLFRGIPNMNMETEDTSWTSASYLPIVFGISIGG